MAGEVDTSWRILATLLTQPRGSEFPGTSLAIPGLALFSFAQTGEYGMRAKRWIERGELDTGGNGLRRILRLLVEHDTVSALRDPSPIGPEFQREGLDLALAESTSVRLTLASETAARAC